MTFKLDQKTDCDIITAENLCKEVFESNGYLVTSKANIFSFLRRNKKNFDRLMPIFELLHGFGEGNMIFTKQNGYLKVRIQHRWIMHIFTSLILMGVFTLIFHLLSRQEFNAMQPFLAFCIVIPMSLIGYFYSKNELQKIFDQVFELIKQDFNVISD